MNWQLAEAKSKFSEVVRLALSEGPQRITRRHDAVVVLSETDYNLIVGKRRSFTDTSTPTEFCPSPWRLRKRGDASLPQRRNVAVHLQWRTGSSPPPQSSMA